MRHFTVSWKISAHFEINGSNKSQTNVQQKAGRVRDAEMKRLQEHLVSNRDSDFDLFINPTCEKLTLDVR